jgi:hypothetical protein
MLVLPLHHEDHHLRYDLSDSRVIVVCKASEVGAQQRFHFVRAVEEADVIDGAVGQDAHEAGERQRV